jgi:phage recombination protein Bet
MQANITPYQPQQIGAFDHSKIDLLKNTICKGASDEEFKLFLHACQRTGLDPFMRQIYAVKRWDSAIKKETITIQTGIDGYRLIAERTGKYSPGREPTFTYGENGNLISATAYVKKQTADGTWHEVAATAFYDEYCQKTKDGKPTRFWQQMAHTMLAKCAEALALRKAFPGDLSGIYTKEEMLQADETNETIAPDCTTIAPNCAELRQKTISKEQWTELNRLIDQCTPSFQQKMTERVNAMGIQSMADLDEETYIKIKQACLGNIAKKKRLEHENSELAAANA